MNKPLILVVEDHPLFRDALISGLSAEMREFRFGHSATLAESLSYLRTHDPDLVLLDLDIPGAAGLTGLVDIKASYPNLKIAILSATMTQAIVSKAIALGAAGYICKTANIVDMVKTVRAMLEDAHRIPTPPTLSASPNAAEVRFATLTPKQLRILRLLMDGMLNKQIAAEMGVQEQTIKEHVSQILRKLGIQTRTQAAMLARSFFE